MTSLGDAIDAVVAGQAIVYPTETVYGLGADATNETAVEQVFTIKGRDRSKPLSVAVPSVDVIDEVANPSEPTRSFMRSFLPGPITVICRRRPGLPDALTAGRDRVGIRIPDHELAISLLEQTPPLTATSANRSGGPNVTHPDELDRSIREAVGAIVNGGRTPGGPSTVVDIDRGEIIRRGQRADAVDAWLATHADSC